MVRFASVVSSALERHVDTIPPAFSILAGFRNPLNVSVRYVFTPIDLFVGVHEGGRSTL